MKVFITVDTEFHPLDGRWSPETAARDVERDIYGRTPQGDFGVFYQAKQLSEHHLKGVFFVESLSSCVIGDSLQNEIVHTLQGLGHEVGLHVHAEWLRRVPSAFSFQFQGELGSLIRHYSEPDQAAIINLAADKLRKTGVADVQSFRAGSYGANNATLRALVLNGIRFDSSLNASRLGGTCAIESSTPPSQPTELEGIREYPIAYFQDCLGHIRHVQLCGCTSSEIERALFSAWKKGWQAFVIVSHSFELIKGRQSSSKKWGVDGLVLDRFKRLCDLLEGHRDKFQTSTFAELGENSTDCVSIHDIKIEGSLFNTIERLAQQTYRRLASR